MNKSPNFFHESSPLSTHHPSGRDATLAFESASHSNSARDMLSCFYVGEFVDPEKESVQSPGSSSMSSPLIDTERALGVLLGLSAASQVCASLE